MVLTSKQAILFLANHFKLHTTFSGLTNYRTNGLIHPRGEKPNKLRPLWTPPDVVCLAILISGIKKAYPSDKLKLAIKFLQDNDGRWYYGNVTFPVVVADEVPAHFLGPKDKLLTSPHYLIINTQYFKTTVKAGLNSWQAAEHVTAS